LCVAASACTARRDARAALDALGTVEHLVKLSDSHRLDEPCYIDRYGPEFWTLEDAQVGDTKPTQKLEGEGPVPGGRVIDYRKAPTWREGAYHVSNGGGTLVTTI
jgi:hypothetical protein